MSAAAAPRKEPGQARVPYTAGFYPLPRHFGRRIAPNLSHAALVCALIIQEETIGRPREPGTPAPETDFTRRQLQEWSHLSERGLELAIRELVNGAKPLIPARKHGHWWRFGPIRQDAEVATRTPRHVTRTPPQVVGSVTVELPVACPVLTGPCPIAEAQLAASKANGKGEHKPKQTRTGVRVGSATPCVINESSSTDVTVTFAKSSPPALRDLQVLLYETEFEFAPGVRLTFPRRFGVGVDPEMLGRILNALGGAPVEQFAQAIGANLRRIHSYAFLQLLAGDCAARPWPATKPAAPAPSASPHDEAVASALATMRLARDPEWAGHIQRPQFETDLERIEREVPEAFAEAEAQYQRDP